MDLNRSKQCLKTKLEEQQVPDVSNCSGALRPVADAKSGIRISDDESGVDSDESKLECDVSAAMDGNVTRFAG